MQINVIFMTLIEREKTCGKYAKLIAEKSLERLETGKVSHPAETGTTGNS